MAIITSQRLSQFYEKYKEVDVTFTKDVVKALGLKTDQVFLKYSGAQVPCVVYSISLTGAKIIANLKKQQFQKIRDAGNAISLRLCFDQEDKVDPFAFFITSKVNGFNPYNKEQPDLNFVSVSYSQRPPDDLIQIIGTLLEMNANSTKRREERLTVSPELGRKLGMDFRDVQVYFGPTPKKAILRDISFGGARFITAGSAETASGSDLVLQIPYISEEKSIAIGGKVVRTESVQDHDELLVAAVQFDADRVPMDYKMRLSDYLSTKGLTDGGPPEDAEEDDDQNEIPTLPMTEQEKPRE